MQRRGDLGGDRHATPRDAEDDDVLVRLDHAGGEDRIRESTARLVTISISHTVRVPPGSPSDPGRTTRHTPVPSRDVRRLLLLSNPSASAFTGAAFREIAGILREHFDVAAEWPGSPSDTRRRAREAAEEGVHVVAAMGGDGVVHHVANGLAGTETALGVIPAGTTNVLVRLLGLPRTPTDAARILHELPTVPTPLLRLSLTSAGERRVEFATFAAGVGYDAAVVEAAERRPHAKLRFGGVHYASTAIGRLLADWRARPPNLRVRANGDRVDAVAVLAQVYGPYTYFGRVPLYLTPERRRGFVALAATDLEVHRSTEIFLRSVFRRHIPSRLGVRIWEPFREITISAEPPSPVEADGELLGTAEEARLTPAPNALRMLRRPDR